MAILSIVKLVISLASCSAYLSQNSYLSSIRSYNRVLNMAGVPLPDNNIPLIIAYANWNECDEKIIDVVKDGANVIIWFSINLAVSETGEPIVTNGPNWDCVAEIIRMIREDLKLQTTHLISIGGWNSPHPDTSNPVEKVYEHWNRWNRETIARPELGFFGFDGFDWDVEGNDDLQSPYNHFTCECLDLMGRFSQLAKQDGYVVSMAPAESYLDYTISGFDRSLQHEYHEWKDIIPAFPYHGKNVYAYLLAKYGSYKPVPCPGTETRSSEDGRKPTFDFVTVQLYEGYSHAEYNVTQMHIPPAEILVQFVRGMTAGFKVNFTGDTELNYPFIEDVVVDQTRLVVGLANGWAGDGKFLLIYPEEVGRAYELLKASGEQPRGFAYWNIKDEGISSPQRPQEPVFMARGLNRFLHIRPIET